jgi:capsular polysaccharide biosynthesis protein
MYGTHSIYNLLRNMFLPKRKSKNDRKIFISRKNIFPRKIKTINQLENLFKNNGYEVLFFEEMSFQDQIDAVYDANKIAAITGSSLTNILFANLKADIMSVNIEVEYDCYDWKDIADALNINYMDFYISTHNEEKIFKVFNLLDGLFDE